MRDGRKTHVSPGRIHESGQAAVPLGGVGGRRAVGELPQAPGGQGVGELHHCAQDDGSAQRGGPHGPRPPVAPEHPLNPWEHPPPEPPQAVPLVQQQEPVEGQVDDVAQPQGPGGGRGVKVGGVLGSEEQEGEHRKGTGPAEAAGAPPRQPEEKRDPGQAQDCLLYTSPSPRD